MPRTKPRPGRPRMPAGEKRVTLGVRLAPATRAKLEALRDRSPDPPLDATYVVERLIVEAPLPARTGRNR